MNILKKIFTVSVVVTTIFWAVGLAALLPLGAGAITLVDGDLIKMDGLSSVYYYAGGQRYVFPNESTYYSWYSDFSGVKTLTTAELQNVPMAQGLGANVTMRPGTKLIKITTDPKVYAVGPKGVLHYIDSEARANTLYGANWAKRVVDVADAFFTNYSVGAGISSDFYPEGSLVKWAGSNDVYYINAAGQKQMVSTDAMTANRFKLADVVTAASTYAPAAGAAITGASSLSDTSQGGALVVPGTGGPLSFSLASDTPAANSVPYSADNVAFTYVNLTAGSSAVTVTGLKVTRFGLGANANFSYVKLYVDGVQQGNSQTLNSANQANFSGISIAVPANTTKKVVIAGQINSNVNGAVAGHLVGLGVAAAADVTSAASVSGAFPVNGNSMTISSVAIGTATLDDGSLNPTTDANVDPDAVDYRFTQLKINANTEDMKLSQLTAVRNGTASDSDVKDLKLYSDKTGTLIGTVASLTNGKAVFSGLNVTIPKGESYEFSLKASLIGGAGRTLGFDFYDGSSYSVMLTGQTYGYGITPTLGTFCTTDGNTAAGLCATQSIRQGYLTVNKSASTPSTGNIPLGGTKVAMATFDFAAKGEPINASSIQIKVDTNAGDVHTGEPADFTNVGLYDENDVLVAGPKDYTVAHATAHIETLTFTDAFTIPLGTHKYTVKAKVSSSALATEDVQFSLPVNSIVGKGANSGKVTYTTSAGTTVAPSGAVAGNVMTIQGAQLAVKTAATPIAQNVVVNAQDQEFMHVDLDATAGGEDVKVTQIIVTNTLGGTPPTAALADILNLELWGDPDNTDATDQSVMLETSNSTAANAATVTFTFTTPVKVSHSKISRLVLKADVAAAVTNATDGTEKFLVPSGVTSTGWSTGQAISESYSGDGQNMSTKDAGTLKVEVSPDRASAAQFVAGTTGNAMMSYKLTSTNEAISVTQFYIAAEGASASTAANIANAKVYVNGTQVGAVSGYTLSSATGAHPTALVTLGASELVVPKDGSVVLTIKVDLVDKAALTSASTVEIGLGDASGDYSDWGANGAYSAATKNYSMVATGKSSGTVITVGTINSTGVASGLVAGSYTMYMYDGVLTVAKDASSPSGVQAAGPDAQVLALKLTAVGDDIAVNEMEFCVTGTATGVSGTGDVTLKNDGGDVTYATMTQTNFDDYWDDDGGNSSNAGTYIPLDPNTYTSHVTCFSFGTTGASGVTIANGSTDSSNKDVVAFTVVPTVAAGSSKVLRLYGDTTGAANPLSLVVALRASGTAADVATTSGLAWSDVQSGGIAGTAVVDATLTKTLPITGGTMTY